MTRSNSAGVTEYISAAPAEAQTALREVRAAIKDVAPEAIEGISYDMPFYDYHGRLAYFRHNKHHLGLYIPPPIIAEYAQELASYKTTMSAVNFPFDQKMPIALIKKLVKAKMKQIKAAKK